MKVTFLGTTTLLFDDGKDQILFDGHVTRPSIATFLLHRLETDQSLADRLMEQFQMDRVRAIFVSHSHYDHVLDVPYLAQKTGGSIYGSASTRNVALGGSVPEERIHVFRPYEEFMIGDYAITVLPAVHSPAKWYNNDLGQIIEDPLTQPARKKEFKEGGSYDFLVKNGGKTYLIHPSFNYIEGEFNNIRADVLFLAIGGMGKAPEDMIRKFFDETIGKVLPKIVIPIHWDNFFSGLDRPIKNMPRIGDDTQKAMHDLAKYCSDRSVEMIIQYPLIRLTF